MDWAWSAVGITILWLVLHSADYLLTIAAARMYARGDLRSRIDVGGRSLELNPVFQRAVNRGAWVSRRFLVSLLVVGLLILAVFTAFEALPREQLGPLAFVPELFAGVLVITRVAVIGGHLQNLALFRRILHHPAAAGVMVRYDRGTVFTARRWSYLQPAVLCALAVPITGSAFFAGGVLGMVGLVAATAIWQTVEARRPPAGPAGHPPGAAGPGDTAPPGGRGSLPRGP